MTGQINVDHFLPLLFGHLNKWAKGQNPGMRADNVQPAQFVYAVIHGFFKAIEVCNVRLGSVDASTRGLYFADGFVQIALGALVIGHRFKVTQGINRDDVGTFLGQQPGVAAALPARGARDECNLAFYSSSHDFLLSGLASGWANDQATSPVFDRNSAANGMHLERIKGSSRRKVRKIKHS